MKQMLLATVATVALLAASSAGMAQSAPDKAKEPAAAAPSAPESQAPKAEAPAPKAQRSEPKGNAKAQADRPGEAKTKSQQSKRATPERNAKQGSDSKQGAPKPPAPKAAEGGNERSKDQPKAAQQPSKATPKAAQGQQPGDAKQGQAQSKDAAKAPAQPVKQVQATQEQRSGVRDRLLKQGRVERTKLNINITVGTAIPRNHRLHALPSTIVSFAPVYRGYSYIVVDDSICIVDPATYVIVDVIPASSQGAGPQRHQLTLSGPQMRFVFNTVPKERKAEVNVRLALGAEVPRNQELFHFPPEVIARVPELEPYRFVVANRDVVIVDPRDNAVMLVINE